jgi:O-methyltransferase
MSQIGVTPEFKPSISVRVATFPLPANAEQLYLDLLKRILTRTLVARPLERHSIQPTGPVRRAAQRLIETALTPFAFELVRVRPNSSDDYLESSHLTKHRAEDAETMVGIRQLDNMQACITSVVHNQVPGDLLEAGVWRGGMTILMRGALKAFADTTRRVWVVDSFAGLPDPDRQQDSVGWTGGDMAVPLEVVRDNFARYGLLDEQVQFLPGLFSETLPHAPIQQLSVLRLDADLYESTRDALSQLYPKLSPGGFAIFDDYLNLRDCRRAIDEYRAEHGITDPIEAIDKRAVYWQKTRP